jgi:hypothetical protein
VSRRLSALGHDLKRPRLEVVEDLLQPRDTLVEPGCCPPAADRLHALPRAEADEAAGLLNADIRPQLREFLAWYEEVLGRIEAGAVVEPGEQERLTEEASAVAHLLDLLDSSADEPAS